MFRSLVLPVLLILLTASGRAGADDPAGVAVVDAEGSSRYFLGAAKVDVTPTQPVLLSGYAARPHELTQEVSQRLWARCIAVGTDEAGPAVLMVVDNCGVPASVRRAVAVALEQRHGVPGDRLTITSTHTHSAPMLTGVLNNLLVRDLTENEQVAVDRYTQELTAKLITVADEALANREDVELRLARGSVPFAINRRGADVVDHELPLIVATGADGSPRALITNYACHCVAAGSGLDISGDWAGYAAEIMEREHPGVTALVLIGCGADQNPAEMNSLAAAQRQGQMLADEVRRLLSAPLTPLSGQLATKFAEIALPLAQLPSREQWQSRADDQNINGYHARKNLARLDRNEPLPRKIVYPVQTWAFGDDLAMVFLGGEVVVDYVHLLRQTLDPNRLWVTAYANDVACYIPSERVLGEGGYEGGDAMVWYDQPAPLASGVEQRILGEVQHQLKDAFDTDHDASTTGGTAPLSPARSMAAMQTHDDLRVELVAAEPLVVDPVAIDFGHDGKLWVAEMHDYPEGVDGNYQPGGRIKFLEDTDGDGCYDRATTFLQDVAFPTGVFVWRAGVLVCAAPDVLYAEDTTGDGRADVVRKVLSGFHTENYQARVNSLSLGLDNWIHGAAGIFGGSITTPDGAMVDANNRDFRFQPDVGEVEAVSGRTQQGRARDDWGNWFGCENGRLLMHYPTTDHYHRRNPHVASPSPSLSAATSQQLFPRGSLVRWALSGPPGVPTSACGLGIYRDTALGEDYSNNTFTCEPVNQLVHRLRLIPDGVTFSGQRAEDEQNREFLSSTDSWFRPVQARGGPDGALYIVDMYRYMIEHPRFLSDEVRATLDVRAGERMGRIYRVVPRSSQRGAVPKLSELETTQVASVLDSPNGTLRDMAHQQLLWRGDRAAAAPLRRIARGARLPQVRLQALAVLAGLEALDAEQVAAALCDPHPGVRRHAARLSEKWLAEDASLGERLAALADDEDAQVRLQVAYSLGEWKHPRAGVALAGMAEEAASDAYIKGAIFSSVNPENAGSMLTALLDLPVERGGVPPLIEELLPLAVRIGDIQALAPAIERVVTPHDGDYAPWQWVVMPQLLRALEGRQLTWEGEQQEAWATMLATAYAVVADEGADEDDRVRAIQLLPYAENRSETLDRLSELFIPQTPVAVQQAAVEALAAVDTSASALRLLDAFDQLTPAVQVVALEAMLARKTLAAELLARIESGQLPRGMIGAAHRQRLANHPDAEIRSRAQALFAAATNDEIAAQIRAYQHVDPRRGSAAQGRELFVKHCAACHRVQDVGHEVGPDLTALSDRSKAALLTAILDPNAAIDQRYAAYAAVTADGQVLTGMIESESSTSVTLKAQENKQHQILRSDLEELQSTGVSLMPEGLAQEIPPAQMEHLLAFVGAGGVRARYTYPGPGGPHENYPDDPNEPKLVDGHFGSDPFSDGTWVGFRHVDGVSEHRILFDFGEPVELHALQITYGVNHQPGGIHAPSRLTLALSDDGESFGDPVAAAELDDSPDGLGAYRIARRTAVVKIAGRTARYARVDVANDGEWTFLSELSFNPPTSSLPKTPAAVATPVEAPEPSSAAPADRMANLLQGVAVGTPDEYRVIPQLFEAAIAAGRRNEAKELQAVLEFSLPEEGEPLRDWQAVVVGGGVVNGISQSGPHPRARVLEIIGQNPDLLARWQRTLRLALRMADDPAVRSGTRYDALRLIAMLPWEEARGPLTRYLSEGTPEELMQGAVSGLADVPHPAAAAQLAGALDHLRGHLRDLAVDGLTRADGNSSYLLDAIADGQIPWDEVADDVRRRLLEHPNGRVREQAKQLLAR